MSTPFLSVPVFYWPAAPGGQLFTYIAGSTTPKQTFSDPAGTIVNANPVILDSTGLATVRLDSGSYHFVLKDSTGTTTLWDADYYDAPYLVLSQSLLAGYLYPQTAIETAAGVTAVNFIYKPGIPDRYGTNTSPGTTDMSAPLQSAVTQMLAGGAPVRFLSHTAYLIVTPPTFGSSTTAMLPIDIGAEGGWAQIINGAAANSPTFDFSGKNGEWVHDLVICGNSTNPNHGIRLNSSGGTESIRSRFERLIFMMPGVGLYGADTNSVVIRDCKSWPDNPPVLPVSITVNNADRDSGAYFTGNFVNDITVYDFDALASTNYKANSRGLKVDASQIYNFRVIGGNFSGETGTNNEIGLQLGGASSNVEGALVLGCYHENSKFQFNNLNNSLVMGCSNGGSGGGLIFQTNSTGNHIGPNAENGATLSFDSGSTGNVYEGGYGTVTDNATVPNRALAVNLWADSGGAILNTLTYAASMTPNMHLGRIIRIVVTDGNAMTIANPTNLTVGPPVYVEIVNASGGAMGTITWGSMYKMSAWTNPANGFSRTVGFLWDTVHLIQLGQTGVDVPN